MSLTRKALSAMGLEADKIDQIIEMHTETVTALKEQINELKDDNDRQKKEAEKLPTVQKELDELKAKVEADAKEREGKDYDALKQEYDNYKAEQEAKATKSAKETALKDLLKDMKMSDKGVTQVLKWMGVDNLELEDGKVKNASELRKSIKEDWGDYIQSVQQKGADPANPPANTGGNTGKTKAEILKIKDAKERQQAILENRQLFGLPAEE